MEKPLRFLVIDDNAASRFLLAKTLMRKFPSAILVECGDRRTAMSVLSAEKLAAVVLHRTGERSGWDLIPEIRRVNPDIPVVLVSDIDRSRDAIAAGAAGFLHDDEWLRIGTVVAGILQVPNPDSVKPWEQDPSRQASSSGPKIPRP